MKKPVLFAAVIACLLAVAGAAWLLNKPAAVVEVPKPPVAAPPVAAVQQPVTIPDVPDQIVRAQSSPAAHVPDDQPDPPGLVISGVVTTTEGQPAAGASVAAYTAQTAAIKAVAREDGTFRVVGLPAGSYRVSANLEHYNEAVQEEVAAGSSGIKLVLEPLSAVEGRVLQAKDSQPVQNFEVLYLKSPPGDDQYWQNVIRDERTQWTKSTDPEGKYRIEDITSNAEFAVAVRAQGFEPAFVAVPAVASGQTAKADDILLRPEARIEGRVISSQKQPVTGAKIYFGREARGRHAAMSNAEGVFTIGQLPAGPLLLSAAHPDYLPGQAETTAVAGQTVKLDIILGGGGSIEGRVTNGQTPLSGQSVSASRLLPPRIRKEVKTDADGYYSIQGLPAGDVEVIAKAQIGDERVSVPLRLQKSATIEDGQVTVVDFDYAAINSSIEGMITVGGQPATIAFIKGFVTSESGDRFFNTSCKSDGSYIIENLPSGSAWLEVTVELDNGSERRKNIPLEIPAGQILRQDIQLDGAATIAGKVIDLSEHEVGQAMAVQGQYQFDPSTTDITELESIVTASADIGPDGAFTITGLDEGSYTVIVIAFDPDEADGTGQLPTVRSKSQAVTVTAGQQATVQIVIS